MIPEGDGPIRYVSGGRLGDTIHQLSVVNEIYLKTGRKGIVYLSETVGDKFDRGVEATFNDIREVIEKQSYIESLHIHNDEPYDINLSRWRNHEFSFDNSWHQAYKLSFDVEWDRTTWISTTPNLEYKDTTFLSAGIFRYNHVLRYHEMYEKIENLVFLATTQEMYDVFVYKTGVRMPYLLCETFSELASAIAGCKGFIGSLSMPYCLADSMWKPRLAIMYGVHNDNKTAMLTDKRFIIYTEDLDAFGWKTPPHPRSEPLV
jgi:hypothetical protein